MKSPNRYRFLLVDDQEETKALVTRTMKMLPHELVWAASAAEGLAKAGQGKFDFIFLDVELPESNGYELCLQISQMQPSVPIFFLSGRNTSTDLLVGFFMGAVDFINKPFRPYELRARTIAHLKKSLAARGEDFYIEIAGLRLNLTKGQAWAGEASLSLEPAELFALAHLMCNPNRAVSPISLEFASLAAREKKAPPSVNRILGALRLKLGVYSVLIENNEDGTILFNSSHDVDALKQSA